MSPLGIGVRGGYEGAPFELAGRLGVVSGEHSWSEWYLLFSDGREGWLVMAPDMSAILFPAAPGAGIPPRSGLYPETRLQIGNDLFDIDEIRNTFCTGSEGRLPFPAPQGRRCLCVDLASDDRARARIAYADEGNALYVGRTVELAELGLEA